MVRFHLSPPTKFYITQKSTLKSINEQCKEDEEEFVKQYTYMYIEQIMTKSDIAIRSLEFSKFVIINNQYKENEKQYYMYIEQIMTKFDTVIGSLELQRKHIEKYIDEIR